MSGNVQCSFGIHILRWVNIQTACLLIHIDAFLVEGYLLFLLFNTKF